MKSISTVLAILLMALICLVGGCGSDIVTPVENDGEGLSHVKFGLDLTLGVHDGTRSQGRPLDSSDPAQWVRNMRIYLFRADMDDDPEDDSAFRYSLIPSADGGEPLEYIFVPSFMKDAIWDSDENETHAYLIDSYLPKGYRYKLLAVGRDDVSEDDKGAPGTLLTSDMDGRMGWTPVSVNPAEATTLASASMSLNVTSVRLSTAELFVGCSDSFSVDDDEEDFLVDIMLKRSVAGVIMYLENIPTHFRAMADFTRPGIMPPYTPLSLITKGKEYKVSSVAIAPVVINTGVGMIGSQPCGETSVNQNFSWYLVDANLSSARERDGFFVDTNPSNQRHPNSVFGGSFILPLDRHDGVELIAGTPEFDHTLYLVFYTNDNDLNDHTFATPFFWYPIENVRQTFNTTSGLYEDAADASEQISYLLEADNIYSLGEKYGAVDLPLDLSVLRGVSSDTRSAEKYTFTLVTGRK